MKLIFSLLLTVLFASGCTSVQTFSSYARSGDTVMVAIGGSETHVNSDMLKKEEVTVTLTDSAGVVHPVSIRNLFRAYPDPTSFYSHTGWDVEATSQSQWTAALDLVDPATGLPLALATGDAIISISGTKLKNFHVMGFDWTNGYLESIAIEILPGQGSRNPINYMPLARETLSFVEPLPQVLVSPSRDVLSSEGLIVSGGEFTLSYPTTLFEDAEINVNTITPDKKTQMAVRFMPQADDTTQVKVIIMNPNGFQPADVDLVTFTNSPYKALKFSLYWTGLEDTVTDSNWQTYVKLLSGKYIDMQGNEITDINPVLAKIK